MEQSVRDIIGSIRGIQKYFKGRAPKGHFFRHGAMNMTIAQLDTLAYLYDKKRAKMSELANNAGVKLPTMTDMVNKLVALGLVRRQHDERDRRTVWVTITKSVEKMVFGHMKQRDEAVAGLMDVLSVDEKKQAAVILKKVVNSLERMH
jgi:DNA-binding MarR family transcriptional regulator